MTSTKKANTTKAKKQPKKASTVSMATGGSPANRSFLASQTSNMKPSTYSRIQSIKNPRYGDALRVHGQDLLQTGAFTQSSDNTMLVNIPIDMATFAGTRLEQFSKLYEKFRFKKLIFKLVTSVSSSVSGSYLMAYDRDASDPTPPNSLTGLKALASYENAKEFKQWEDGQIVCPLIQPDDGYYTNSGTDERLFTQGQFYLYQVFASSLALQKWALWIEYELELFVPQLEQEFIASVTNNNTAFNPATVTDWFTSLSIANSVSAPSKAVIGNAPSGLKGVLLNAGEYAGNLSISSGSTGNPGGFAVGLGTLIPVLEAVVGQEQSKAIVQIANQVNSLISASPSSGNLGSSRSFSLSIPPGGAWLELPGAGDGINTVVSGLILSLILSKGQSFFPF